ncbi:MAG: twin-arginine translocase subunit TatC [Gammaproteobacteria bacterium]|nr:twin-arginine translocase subunit TatC [Gammaproteobacteria bacterium]MDX5374248.1 twin-arginine translocase subunit TatC [Gammaproteobacteria bacterium]
MSESRNNPDAHEETQEQEQGFLAHLFELRDRLLRIVLVLVVGLLVLLPFSQEIFTWFSAPLNAPIVDIAPSLGEEDKLPTEVQQISTKPMDLIMVQLKLLLLLVVVVTLPYLLYQIWGFVAPGLYRHEKRLAAPLLVSSVLLFYLGVAFAYLVVVPMVMRFLISFAPEGVAVMPDIAAYYDFSLMLYFAFGIAFEVPVATVLLVASGIATPDGLAAKRPYVVVGAFIIGMFMTPPDVISQVMLAVPMWLLFEIGLIVSRVFLKKQAAEGEAEEEAYRPLSDEEMDAELDAIERAEAEEALRDRQIRPPEDDGKP